MSFLLWKPQQNSILHYFYEYGVQARRSKIFLYIVGIPLPSVCTHVHGLLVEVRGLLVRVDSLLLPSEFQDLILVGQQEPLQTSPSRLPNKTVERNQDTNLSHFLGHYEKSRMAG